MPKLFEYLGIIIFFWSNEHEPIHVHGEYQGRQSKAELTIENGKITAITIKDVRGRRPLEGNALKNFKEIVAIKSDEIVQLWIEYFVMHKKIPFQRITKKIDSNAK